MRRTVAGVVTLLCVAVLAAPPVVARPRLPHGKALGDLPAPSVGGRQIVKGLEDFVTRFPLRYNSLTPANPAAAQFLHDEARGLGYSTRIIKYSANFGGLPDAGRIVRVVEAVKPGTKYPDQYIALIAHYDGGAAQYHGAYDNGSGANMLRYFARAFSKVKTERSIVLLWFDGEEDGLLGSERYARMARETDMDIRAVLSFDMVGIGYPAPYCICVFYGNNKRDAEIGKPLIDLVNFDYLQFPQGNGGSTTWPVQTAGGHVCNCGANDGSSDERSFERENFFTLRWRGMREQLDYPGYHMPWDTVDFMAQVAGSRRLLELGMKNTLFSGYYTALTLDRL